MKNKVLFHPCVCKRHADEPVVQNDLAVTPSQMMELTRSGLGISSQNLRLFEAADPADHDYYIPIQYRKGVDIADIYEQSMDIRSRFKKAVKDYDDGKISAITPQDDSKKS